jgi:hypothetical protein
MAPVNSPGIFFICAIAKALFCSGQQDELICFYDEMPVPYLIPAFTSQAIDQDIVSAAIPALPIVTGGPGEISDVCEVQLTEDGIGFYRISPYGLRQADQPLPSNPSLLLRLCIRLAIMDKGT